MLVTKTSLVRHAAGSVQRRMVSASAVTFDRNGAPSNVLRSGKVSVGDSLGAKQVLVKMVAAPVSALDLQSVAGLVPGAASKGVCGNEGVGIVEQVGSGVKGFKAGDHVVPTKRGVGTWASHAVADEGSLVAVPKDLDIAQAALLGVAPATAIRVLADISPLKAGDAIVVDGANSAVGMAVVQVAAAKGLKAVAIVSQGVSDYKGVAAQLKAAGAVAVADHATAGSAAFRKVCADLKPALGVHCASSRGSATAVGRVLAPGATLVAVSGAGPVTLPSSLLIDRGIKVVGFNLGNALGSDAAKTLSQAVELVKSGKLKQAVAAQEPLANFASAVQKASSNPNGSVLLKM